MNYLSYTSQVPKRNAGVMFFLFFFVILIVDGNDELKMILTMVEGWMGWLVVMLCTVASPVPSTRTYDSYVSSISSIALIDGLHMKCIRA